VKIIIWKTNHEIADTVADAIKEGIDGGSVRYTHQGFEDADVHIGYGILRGMDDIFKQARNYIHLDRGYIHPAHYSGNYRISLNGTQQVDFWPEPSVCTVPLAPWRGFDHTKPVLVCPLTEAVSEFFGVDWWVDAGAERHVWRHKGDPTPLNFSDYNYVLTFNSSVGWQALAAGIPCVSDPTYSMVGSFFKNIPLAKLSEAQYLDREKMFGCMESMQLTLQEMRDGKLWPIISSLLRMKPRTALPLV
jgi:hypothetical protein